MRGRIIRLILAAVGLYFVWPTLVEVFGSYDDLAKIRPIWFLAMALLEAGSFVCVWLLIGISTSSKHWLLIATAQLVGNAVGSIVPGGGAVGGPMQYSYMVRGGEDPERVISGLATTTLLSLTTLFGLAAMCVPLMFHASAIDPRLEHAAWLGTGVFVILMGLGALAFTLDGFVRALGTAAQWAVNFFERIRRKPRTNDLTARVMQQRDRVRDVLGAKWPWALLAVLSKYALDFFALVAAVAASGLHARTLPVLLAYIVAGVLAMIPITPGGLGFVEAGLTATLVWAGVPAANATLAVLAYRLVSYWLPLVAGVAAAVVYQRSYPERVTPAS